MPSPGQDFDEEALGALAASIADHGLIQPIAVRPLSDGYYQIIAGERRWRASRLAGLKEVPVTILEADDKTAAELTLIENLQREDLNPMEEARGYAALISDFGMSQEETGKKRWKSENYRDQCLAPAESSQVHRISGGGWQPVSGSCPGAASPSLREHTEGSGTANSGSAAFRPSDGGHGKAADEAPGGTGAGERIKGRLLSGMRKNTE